MSVSILLQTYIIEFGIFTPEQSRGGGDVVFFIAYSNVLTDDTTTSMFLSWFVFTACFLMYPLQELVYLLFIVGVSSQRCVSASVFVCGFGCLKPAGKNRLPHHSAAFPLSITTSTALCSLIPLCALSFFLPLPRANPTG